ncbi:Major Facilitator Superfamily with SPX (SYG1/Pho81/XPR1) domain-containing protein [Hibiscus syriacus]|uniref:Major Facilitator Superfamily with SPX (SYG1/Pho81/XPR1) domain-containing protein n=1 Tax=Hibiscus syriacus TaxID=106335 RepID=A0A6A2ZP79_HIBSY|nr:uncharacterized protein LOC120141047 [Hibiscus syriacus]KAE8693821.1 Major Facilitator Superfamily with SPX (SYG1/Pho81/XPR1) domain-containing protein [Hibiscus syriacus]
MASDTCWSRMFAEDEASWCCIFVLVTLLLLNSFEETNSTMMNEEEHDGKVIGGRRLLERACDEIYVVAEGETLHSISDKCGDPFIVEHNPHIHDPDDVFPGLVIKITPPSSLSSTSFKR